MRLREILTERADQAAEIVGLLQTGMMVDPEAGMIQIRSHDEFVEHLKQRYQITKIGQGFFSVAHRGGGEDYVIKWSRSSDAAKADAWFTFAAHAKKSKNALMPEILFAGAAGFSSNLRYGVLEFLKIPARGHFDNRIQKLFREYNTNPIHGEISIFDEAMRAVYDWLVENETGLPEDELEEFLIMIGTDALEMQEFLKETNSMGELDIYDQNIGYRKNGQLVIFDPAS